VAAHTRHTHTHTLTSLTNASLPVLLLAMTTLTKPPIVPAHGDGESMGQMEVAITRPRAENSRPHGLGKSRMPIVTQRT